MDSGDGPGKIAGVAECQRQIQEGQSVLPGLLLTSTVVSLRGFHLARPLFNLTRNDSKMVLGESEKSAFAANPKSCGVRTYPYVP